MILGRILFKGNCEYEVFLKQVELLGFQEAKKLE